MCDTYIERLFLLSVVSQVSHSHYYSKALRFLCDMHTTPTCHGCHVEVKR